MAEQFSQERTEAATPRKREEARRRGQVALSTDLNQAIFLLVGIATLWIGGPQIAELLRRTFRYELLMARGDSWTVSHTASLVQALAGRVLWVILPLMLVSVLAAVASNVLQVGFRLTSEPLALKVDKLDPIKGFGKIFSVRSVIRTIFLLIKLTLCVAATLWFLSSNEEKIAGLGQKVLVDAVAETWRFGLTICLVVSGVLCTLALADLLYQRWQFEQDLMMSKQEFREEHRQEEGDPQVRSRIRKMARESLKMQMLQRVPQATVVLTNPTHFAVALKYDRATMAAPRVIAKGSGAFARRIAKVAREHGIPVLERKPLARALFASVEVDQEIPANLYRAIAEILAYIYELKKAG